jgi:hypothetical protein
MGERLESFDFAPGRPRGRPAKYPLREWTDGSIWRITRGVDYDVATRSIQATLFAYAGRAQLSLRTRRIRVDGREALVFRFADRAVTEDVTVDRDRRWRWRLSTSRRTARSAYLQPREHVLRRRLASAGRPWNGEPGRSGGPRAPRAVGGVVRR